ncbi:DUF6223 family protein [Paractinoplanes rishiriensis]|uniref:Uncharacterized protein n=1 Tax=Paractinoplanes rishiriensis TaxID=1050105 RepID=A0A919K1Y3_9ACTN|nr:DUF6223 family protein [Actinoplanes rishiriensis]GIE97540.1 hypothetical protein Ari01nite_50050 [Actinoplanes rishiriensis]
MNVAVQAYTLTGGRLAGTAAALIALAGLVLGGLALVRSAAGSRRPLIAMAAGLLGTAGGAVVIAAADGGPGSGSGIVGGFAAVVIGLLACASGWLAAARSRRT